MKIDKDYVLEVMKGYCAKHGITQGWTQPQHIGLAATLLGSIGAVPTVDGILLAEDEKMAAQVVSAKRAKGPIGKDHKADVDVRRAAFVAILTLCVNPSALRQQAEKKGILAKVEGGSAVAESILDSMGL